MDDIERAVDDSVNTFKGLTRVSNNLFCIWTYKKFYDNFYRWVKYLNIYENEELARINVILNVGILYEQNKCS